LETADGTPQLITQPQLEFVDDGAGKPVGINRFIVVRRSQPEAKDGEKDAHLEREGDDLP